MYKKIKNGSFMNWIWFFICIAPILLLIIYSIGFFNSKDLEINQNDKYTLELNSINGNTLKEETNILNASVLNGTQLPNNNGYFESEYNSTNNYYFNYVYANQTLDTKYLYVFTDKQNLYNTSYILIQFGNTNNEILNKNYDYTFLNQNNYTEIDLQTIWNNFESENNTWNNTVINALLINNEEEFNLYIIASATRLYLNYNWFNNYKNYINNFNTIKYNSCPISYTYNNITYNIETNSNNYLGTNESIEINQNFNYTQDEEIILNYNNYFPSNVITATTTNYGMDLGNQLNTTNPNIVNVNTLSNDLKIYNSSWQYYRISGGTYNYYNPTQANIDNWASIVGNDRVFVGQQTNTTYNFEYYNIESTTNTSLTLIPNNTYQDYLNNINDTLKTNGFIANTFLNLSTYFNVSNVYYSLRAYYVEYLLIMILLHLAFDILYILPNICHKFMEKIGGERD